MTTTETETAQEAPADPVAGAQMRMLELFAALCAAPDDAELTRTADVELTALDAMLPATG